MHTYEYDITCLMYISLCTLPLPNLETEGHIYTYVSVNYAITWEHVSMKFDIKKKDFRSRKTMHLKISCAKWRPDCIGYKVLTHWAQVMYTGVGNLTIISSDNGLSPGRCQVIVWTNAGILLIGPLGTNFSEILIEIQKHFYPRKSLPIPPRISYTPHLTYPIHMNA